MKKIEIQEDGAAEDLSKKKRALVVRRNDLVFGKHRMNINQMRLFAWMVSEINSEDDDFKPCRIYVKDFNEAVGLKGEHMYSEMMELTRSMIQHVVEVHDYDEKVLRQRPLLSASDYQYGEGYVELRFHPDLKPYLLQVKERFSAVPLDTLLKLETAHSFRLYEILRAERFKGGIASFSEDDLRMLLGIGKDEYTRFSNFKARVIAPNVKALQKTDMPVTYSVSRVGKAVDKVEFTYLKPDAATAAKEDVIPDVLLARLRKAGMSEGEANRIVGLWAQADPDRILFHLEHCKAKKVPLAWLRAGIRDDYRKKGPSAAVKAKEREKEAAERAHDVELRNRTHDGSDTQLIGNLLMGR